MTGRACGLAWSHLWEFLTTTNHKNREIAVRFTGCKTFTSEFSNNKYETGRLVNWMGRKFQWKKYFSVKISLLLCLNIRRILTRILSITLVFCSQCLKCQLGVRLHKTVFVDHQIFGSLPGNYFSSSYSSPGFNYLHNSSLPLSPGCVPCVGGRK